MSVARPARGVVRRCLASTPSTTSAAASIGACQQFHSSAARPKRQPRFRNLKAEEMGLTKGASLSQYQLEKFPAYTKEELERLQAKYTPQQMEAIKAGEQAIDPEDLVIQGRIREDGHRPTYIEDYTRMDPRYDLKPEVEATPQDVEWLGTNEWMDKYAERMSRITDRNTNSQLTRAMARALRRVKESKGEEMIDMTGEELDELERNPELLSKYLVQEGDAAGDAAAEATPDTNSTGSNVLTRAQAMQLDEAIDAEWQKELEKLAAMADQSEVGPSNVELMEDSPAGVSRLHSAEAAELGKVPGVEGLYRSAVDPEDEGQDDSGAFQEIKRLTGLKLKEVKSILRKVLVMRYVTNQTRLGKVRSVSIVALAGNGDGRLGLGSAKSTEMGVAMETAMMLAIRNMKPIPRYENRTIFGNVKAKISGTVVELFTRPPGKFTAPET